MINWLFEILLRSKTIATRDLTNKSVNIVDIEGDSVSEITVDIVREAIKRYNIELEKYDNTSASYKHISIDKDEMVKKILRSLGDMNYVHALLQEIKVDDEVSNDKRSEG